AGRRRPAGRGGGELRPLPDRPAVLAVPAWRPSRAREGTTAGFCARSWRSYARARTRRAVLRDATNGQHEGRIVDLEPAGESIRGVAVPNGTARPAAGTARPAAGAAHRHHRGRPGRLRPRRRASRRRTGPPTLVGP